MNRLNAACCGRAPSGDVVHILHVIAPSRRLVVTPGELCLASRLSSSAKKVVLVLITSAAVPDVASKAEHAAQALQDSMQHPVAA